MRLWQVVCGLCIFLAAAAFGIYQIVEGLTAGTILAGLKSYPRWIGFKTEPVGFMFGFACYAFGTIVCIVVAVITCQFLRRQLLALRMMKHRPPFVTEGRESFDD
jgi:hypothetical protein